MIQEQMVSITSQGQLTIPKSILKSFGIVKGGKAVVGKVGNEIIVKPKRSLFDLAGSLGGKIKLTDVQLRKAREAFEKEWPRPLPKTE